MMDVIGTANKESLPIDPVGECYKIMFQPEKTKPITWERPLFPWCSHKFCQESENDQTSTVCGGYDFCHKLKPILDRLISKEEEYKK
jgi:hypothetical protein